MSTKTRTLTSESGVVTLAFLDAGTTVLQIRKIGYKEKMIPLVVSPAETASVTVLLQPLAQTLPGVLTTAAKPATGKLAEFERRRAMGFGHFLSQDMLERHGDRRMSEVLQLMPSCTSNTCRRERHTWPVAGAPKDRAACKRRESR